MVIDKDQELWLVYLQSVTTLRKCRPSFYTIYHPLFLNPHLSPIWQRQWSTGRRWQLRKIDEPEAKGCIPLDILRKQFDLASLSSHKTLWQLIKFLLCTHKSQWHHAFTCLNSVCPEWVSSLSGSPAVPWATPLVTPRSGEVTERKWRCHGSGFLNWWGDLNENWATVALWRPLKPEQIY